jgi:callose synthase
MEIARAYDNMMGLILFLPIIFLSWLPGVSKFHTHLLFNKPMSEEVQISRILSGETREFE